MIELVYYNSSSCSDRSELLAVRKFVVECSSAVEGYSFAEVYNSAGVENSSVEETSTGYRHSNNPTHCIHYLMIRKNRKNGCFALEWNFGSFRTPCWFQRWLVGCCYHEYARY